MSALFGDILKEWRGIRRLSQLDLSLEAHTSSRHLSFLESGRSRPSREMILKLGEALQMPKSAINKAMLAAGFAPAYPDLPQDDEVLSPVRSAIEIMLTNHLPLPGIVIDRHWNVINANAAAFEMFAAAGAAHSTNMIELLINDEEDASIIRNWPEVVALALARLRTENLHLGGDKVLEDMIARLAAHPRLAKADVSGVDLFAPVIPATLRVDGQDLSLFSTIAQFGTVQDVTLGDIRIELMFPADAATAQWFEKA